MSRTDELKSSGARSVTGGGSDAPFVRWGDSKAWIEGTVLEFWDGKYGTVMSVKLTDASNNARAGDADNPEPVSRGETVNVGLNSTLLQDVPEKVGVGAEVHVAFTGWESSQKSGNSYRLFEVLEIEPGEEAPSKPTKDEKMVDGPQGGPAPGPGGGPGQQPDVPPPEEDSLPF